MNGTGKFENEATAGCKSNECTNLVNLGASLYYPCTCGTATCTKSGATGQSCNALNNTCTDPDTSTDSTDARLFTIVDGDDISPKAHSGYPVQVLLLSGAA